MMNISRVGDWEREISNIAEIEQIFSELKQNDFFHIILNDGLGNQIECKGEIRQLLLKMTQIEEEKTQKITLGVSKEDRSETTIPYQDSEILVRKNEILMLEDAMICFQAFFQGIPLPNAFNQRITN